MPACAVPTRPDLHAEAAESAAAPFMEAMVAAYALMAHADGEVAASERRRLFAIARETPALEPFAHDDIAGAAAEHEANYRLDPEVAQELAWEKLAPLAGRHRAAALVIAACREIIPADGVGHPSEYRMLAEMRARLGVDELSPRA